MPNRRYVIRRYIAARDGHVVDETSVVGFAEARYRAAHLAEEAAGVEVLDPERGVVAAFGTIPERR